jgi:hypothetical protein
MVVVAMLAGACGYRYHLDSAWNPLAAALKVQGKHPVGADSKQCGDDSSVIGWCAPWIGNWGRRLWPVVATTVLPERAVIRRGTLSRKLEA